MMTGAGGHNLGVGGEDPLLIFRKKQLKEKAVILCITAILITHPGAGLLSTILTEPWRRYRGHTHVVKGTEAGARQQRGWILTDSVGVVDDWPQFSRMPNRNTALRVMVHLLSLVLRHPLPNQRQVLRNAYLSSPVSSSTQTRNLYWFAGTVSATCGSARRSRTSFGPVRQPLDLAVM